MFEKPRLPFFYRPLQFLCFAGLGAFYSSIILKAITPLDELWGGIVLALAMIVAISAFCYWAAREEWEKHCQFCALALVIGGLIGTWL